MIDLQQRLASQRVHTLRAPFTVIRSALGRTPATEVIRLKRQEWLESARHVSGWTPQRDAAAF